MVGAALLLLLCLSSCGSHVGSLSRYNVDPAGTTVSGLSSGGEDAPAGEEMERELTFV